MGKRKRRAVLDLSIPPSAPSSPPPDSMQCSVGMNPSSSKSSARDTNTTLKKKLQASSKDTPVMDNSVKQQTHSQISLSHHHHPHHHHNHNHHHHRQNQGRSAYLKRSRYHGAAHHHLSRSHFPADYSSNNSSLYNRYNKRTPFPDQQNQKLSFKVGSRWNMEWRPSSEGIEKLIYQTERITASTSSSSSAVDMSTSAVSDMVCVLCQDLFRHNPEYCHAASSSMVGHAASSSMVGHDDTCMVAVLVCGHVFHAYCLEKRTPARDARDPPCPLCSGVVEKAQEE